MLTEPIEAPGETSPAEVLSRYRAALSDAVAAAGTERVVGSTDLDPATVSAIESGDPVDVDLRDAAVIFALGDGTPDAEALLGEVRDRLLLDMSSAMLDVERIAADVDGDLDPKEVQGKVEGRHPMTLAEYARIHHYVASAK